MSTIVVCVEHNDGAVKRASLEDLGAVATCADQVIAVLGGEGAEAAASGALGAAKAITLGGDTYSPDSIAAGIADVVRAEGAKAFFTSATSTGRDLAPRVAALLESTLFSDCVAVSA